MNNNSLKIPLIQRKKWQFEWNANADGINLCYRLEFIQSKCLLELDFSKFKLLVWINLIERQTAGRFNQIAKKTWQILGKMATHIEIQAEAHENLHFDSNFWYEFLVLASLFQIWQ